MIPGRGEVTRLAQRLIEHLASDMPANVALMHLLMEAASSEEAEAAVARAAEQAGDEAARNKVDGVAALLRAHPDSWGAVHAIAETVEHEAPSTSPEFVLAYWAEAFDRLARTAPEAGVALYALGNPDLLASATAEVVDHLQAWNLLGPETDVLDLGCGIGRFAEALAPRVRSVLGLDLSGQMVAEARRRSTCSNVRFERSSGRDLGAAQTAGFGLVLAADVFPYLVQAGGSLAETHVREAARVLRRGGSLVVLNYSYRGDPNLDRSDVTRLADTCGFDAARLGSREFRLWDAAAFHLVRRS